jgi:hydroxyacylglutathione hydrolase
MPKAMKKFGYTLLVISLLMWKQPASAQLPVGSLDMHWDEGAEACEKTPSHAAIQVHRYDAKTFILRESLCATFEAPFMYLLIGSSRALLIDTGDVEDPRKAPLADTVIDLLPSEGSSRMPLLVLHTHRHLDHRAGDAQFTNRAGVQVVPAYIEDVQKYFGFKHWPEEIVQVDLGARTIDVIPAPGHNPTHIAFYDRSTGLFFSGDFMLPGRLLVDDIDAYRASALRVANFVKTHPVTYVLGGHIEMNRAEGLFPGGSTHHPDERALPLTRDDLLGLPATLESFNGFYTQHGKWVLVHQQRQLIALGGAAFVVLTGLILLARRYFRRRKLRTSSATR